MEFGNEPLGVAHPVIDRQNELNELRAISERGQPSLALLYGRRRVGKTYLLDHAWPGRRLFYFLAGDTTSALNREELLREIVAFLPASADADPVVYPSWRNVFRLFADLATDEPLIVVLDEFQYLMGQQDDVVSHLMAVWDRELRGRPLMLVVCGSEVATMERLERGDSPLYGRWNWAARLRPFNYADAAKMIPGRAPREAALAYGIFGGTPRFLAAIQSGDTLARRVIDTVLSPRGEVHLQLERLIEQEKGIRDTAEYRAVLTAIAGGRTVLDEIAAGAGLADRLHVVRRAVGVLENLELIRRERNFDAPARAAYRYRISDNAARFWYHFVAPNRSQLETGGAPAVWERGVEPHLNAYMGSTFERMAFEAFILHHAAWGLPAAIEWGRWEGRDRNRRSIELDIVARLDDGRILTGEVKWSLQPVDLDIHATLWRNLEDLGRSGQGWSRDAMDADRSAGHLYVSAAGFTPRFCDAAASDARIHLVSLDDMYRTP